LGRVPRGHSTGMRAAPAGGDGLRQERPTARGRSWRARGAALLGSAVAAGLLSGCGGGGGDGRPAAADEAQPTTTAAPAETTTTLSATQREEQAVTQALEAAVQARVDATAPPTPDPELPALTETHTGLMLERWVNTATGLQLNGFAIRYPPNSQRRSEVENISFDEVDGHQVAVLDVCTVDDGERIDVASGEVLSSGVFTIQSREAMRKEGGTWKLAERQEISVEEGVTGCAAD
jgi:hypothetical protein